MRLIKNNAQVKSVKNKISKNKSIIDEINTIKYKLETPFFQDKLKKNNNIIREKLKEKAFKDSQVAKKVQSNTNIYKPNKNIQNKSTTTIKKNLDKKSVYNKNKTISLNTSNNINIGNNINIITNNHIHENNNEGNLPNNNLITNNTNQGMNTEFYTNKKSSINEFYNNNDNMINNENRINRIREAMGYKARRFKGKNASMEHRNHKFGKDLLMSDGDLMTDEENIDMRSNYRLIKPYKLNSPTEFYNKNLRLQQFKSNNENNLFTNNLSSINNNYFYNKAGDNMDEGDIFYNKYNQKSNNGIINNNRNKYNTIISYKDPIKTFYFNNDFQNQTTNGFYIHKTPMNVRKRFNKNLITNREQSDDDSVYTSYINYLRNNEDRNRNNRIRRNHSVIEENNLALSPYKNYLNTNYNYLDNLNLLNTNRRSKNRVKIIKKNNSTSIQEYNLSVAGDDEDTNEFDENRNKFLLTNNFKNERMNPNLIDNKVNNSTILNEAIGLKKYYDNFKKNIQPITNTQFNINSSISQINVTYDNFNNFTSTNKKNSNFPINENTISNSKSTNNMGFTPNFSETGKTPTRLNNIMNTKIRSFNDEINEINANSFNNSFISKNNNDDKLSSQKKQKQEDPTPTSGTKKKNSFSNINKNLNKIVNNNFEIYHNDSINYFGIEKEKQTNSNLNSSNKKKNNDEKFVFENENDMIDYIYNKFEEERKKKNYFNRKLRFTGFVLSKKYKGKNLYDVRIEDNIDKINQQLKDEQILISNKPVEFRFTEDDNEDINDNNNDKQKEKDNVKEDSEKINEELEKLNEENKRLKAENDKLNKKDLVKNGLIKKLDNEKQNFLEEIQKLKEEIEELKNNNKNKEKNDTLYKIENNNFFNIKSNINKGNNKNKNIEEDSEENGPNILYNFKVTFNKIQKGKITKSNKKKEKEKSEFETKKDEKK